MHSLDIKYCSCQTQKVDIEKVRHQLDHTGFSIAENVIEEDFIFRQRERWLHRLKRSNVNRKFVRGSLILGEKNFLSYSNIPEWCLYRYFEFLWNPLEDEEAIVVHQKMNEIRNILQFNDGKFGEMYNPSCYGVYISTSLYEAGKGHLNAHVDGHGESPILHYMIPLSFKGQDYIDGGLQILDKNGSIHDVDSKLDRGSVVFFDGRQKHGVQKIVGDKFSLGRLATFAIPTFFKKSSNWGVAKRSIRVGANELLNKLKIRDFS